MYLKRTKKSPGLDNLKVTRLQKETVAVVKWLPIALDWVRIQGLPLNSFVKVNKVKV